MRPIIKNRIQVTAAALGAVLLVVFGITTVGSNPGETTLRLNDLRARVTGHNHDYLVIALEVEEAREHLSDMDDLLAELEKGQEQFEELEISGLEEVFSGIVDSFEQEQKQARKAVSLLEHEKEILAEKLTRQAEKLYYTYFVLREEEKVQQETLDYLREMFDMEKERRKQGLITLQEIERAVIRVEQGELIVGEARDRQIDVVNRLKLLTGYDLDVNLRLVEPALPEIEELNRREAVANALNEGVTVRKREKQYELNPGEKERLKLEQARREARLQVEETFRAVQRAEQAYRLQERDLDLAESNLERSRARYEAGLVSGPELMESYLALMKARQDYTQSGYDYSAALRDFRLAQQGVIMPAR